MQLLTADKAAALLAVASAVAAAAAHEAQLDAEAAARAQAELVDTVQAQLRAAREASLEAAREAAAVRAAHEDQLIALEMEHLLPGPGVHPVRQLLLNLFLDLLFDLRDLYLPRRRLGVVVRLWER